MFFLTNVIKKIINSNLNDLKKVESNSGVLEECREINLKFAEKAFELMISGMENGKYATLNYLQKENYKLYNFWYIIYI
mgnify:CR=1 FL=1